MTIREAIEALQRDNEELREKVLKIEKELEGLRAEKAEPAARKTRGLKK